MILNLNYILKYEEHAASVKVRSVNNEGREFGPDVIYRIPKDNGKYKKCEIIDKNNKYKRFDSEYGDMIRVFVDNSKDYLNDYWYSSGDNIDELSNIENKIRARYNKHVRNKNRNKK